MIKKFKLFPKILGFLILITFISAISLSAAEIYNQPFTSDLGDMDTVSVVGSQTWYWQSYDNGCATMAGYDGGQFENEDWLITPQLNFTNYSDVTLNFREAINFEGGNVNDNEVILISTDYTGSGDPNTANWTELTVTGRSSGGSWTFVDVDPVDLSAYDGESVVYIAFKYLSSDTNAGTWEIGELVVSGTSAEMPEISNVTQTPESGITSSTTVSVSAEIIDPDGEISLAELHWGTTSGNLTNTINMSNSSGDIYETDSDIPAQADETTVYYEVYAEDNAATPNSVTSTEYSYTVTDPATTTLPYTETFDTDLGDCYTYSVSGDTKEWYWYSGDEAASCNGYNSGDLETDWLILPGINLDDYENEIFVFDSWYNYGVNNSTNHLKVYYSTDYAGIGDPTTASWDSLAFTRPGSSETWASSGEIDLSGISGTSVWIGFKYNYASDYRLWEVDNISIGSGPILSVNPTELSGFSYFLGSGPSGEQVFTVQGSNLSDDVGISAPTDYEISETPGSGFTGSITLTPTSGSITETPIFVRLKAGLGIGDYNNEDIDLTTMGVATQSVTCNGSVYEAVPELMLSEIADPADDYQARFVEIYNGSGATIDFGSETWYLCKQANGSGWSDMQLTGSLSDEGVFVIANSQTVFENTYGFTPNMSNGSVINGNGNDGYFLYYGGDHSNGVLVDAYGAVDQNGSGTAWDYEDSDAERDEGVTQPSPSWIESEWTITSPANAADCTPGVSNLGGGSVTPSIQKAYSISSTEIDVFYDMDMTSVVNSDYTLTGSETVTFSNAFIDSDNLQLVHLMNPSATIVADTTLDNLEDAGNDTNYDFYAGITPIALTNTLNPGGHIDNGQLATFQAYVTAGDSYNSGWVSDYAGAYNGVLVFSYDLPDSIDIGDRVLFTAERDQYFGLTELTSPVPLNVEDGILINPTVIAGSDIDSTINQNTNPAEKWEGQLVKIEDVEVATPVDPNLSYIGSDDGWTTSFIIGDNVDYEYSSCGPILDQVISTGETVNVVGVVDFDYGNYRINPRDSADISGYEAVDDTPNSQKATLVNYPNPVKSQTTISFNLKQNTGNSPSIKIYNLQGQLIKILNTENNSATWDCTNELNKKVANGIYFYKLETENETLTKKMLLVK